MLREWRPRSHAFPRRRRRCKESAELSPSHISNDVARAAEGSASRESFMPATLPPWFHQSRFFALEATVVHSSVAKYREHIRSAGAGSREDGAGNFWDSGARAGPQRLGRHARPAASRRPKRGKSEVESMTIAAPPRIEAGEPFLFLRGNPGGLRLRRQHLANGLEVLLVPGIRSAGF